MYTFFYNSQMTWKEKKMKNRQTSCHFLSFIYAHFFSYLVDINIDLLPYFLPSQWDSCLNASAKKKVVEVRSRVVYKHTTSKIYKKANKKMVSAVSSLPSVTNILEHSRNLKRSSLISWRCFPSVFRQSYFCTVHHPLPYWWPQWRSVNLPQH